ncbi:glutaredoxin [Sorochytrium milnesiophthora]
MTATTVRAASSDDDARGLLHQLGDIGTPTMAVLYFWADWAPQCAQMTEVFAELAKLHGQHLSFVSIEAEELPDTSEQFEIAAVPSFVVVKRDGQVVERVSGADAPELTAVVGRHAAKAKAQAGVSASSVTTTTATTGADGSTAGDMEARLRQLVNMAPVVLFMKGTPAQPRCGFSRQMIEILNEREVRYSTYNILADEAVRQALKAFSNWPTYPQLYIRGELVGGIDIVRELIASDEFNALLPVEEDLPTRLGKLTRRSPVMIFVKGSPGQPKCGFSNQLMSLLQELHVPFDHFDILSDDVVRQGLKTFSNWPTFPQVYVRGELVGGLDIVKEMVASGDFQEMVKDISTHGHSMMSEPLAAAAMFTPIKPRWDHARYRRHTDHLLNIRATVDTKCPPTFRRMVQSEPKGTTADDPQTGDAQTPPTAEPRRRRGRVNLKKEQMERDRQAEVDHANALLVQKFQQVGIAKHKEYDTSSSSKELCRTLSERQRTKRNKNLQRIDTENKQMLFRLEARRPNYDVMQWDNTRARELVYLVNVSRFRRRWIDEQHHHDEAAPSLEQQERRHDWDPALNESTVQTHGRSLPRRKSKAAQPKNVAVTQESAPKSEVAPVTEEAEPQEHTKPHTDQETAAVVPLPEISSDKSVVASDARPATPPASDSRKGSASAPKPEKAASRKGSAASVKAYGSTDKPEDSASSSSDNDAAAKLPAIV